MVTLLLSDLNKQLRKADGIKLPNNEDLNHPHCCAETWKWSSEDLRHELLLSPWICSIKKHTWSTKTKCFLKVNLLFWQNVYKVNGLYFVMPLKRRPSNTWGEIIHPLSYFYFLRYRSTPSWQHPKFRPWAKTTTSTKCFFFFFPPRGATRPLQLYQGQVIEARLFYQITTKIMKFLLHWDKQKLYLNARLKLPS